MQKFFKIFLHVVFFLLPLQGEKMMNVKQISLPYDVLFKKGEIEIRQGGFGSSIFSDLKNKNRFYGVTDKGVKGITPKIGHFEIKNNSIKLLHVINLKEKVNPEGLVVLSDGTFWISDEFKNNLIHFDENGNLLERVDFLPREFKHFRKNKGFEGLAISKDENTLIAIMQASLQNPNKKTKKTRLTRIVALNLKTKKTSQYLYMLENKKHLNSEIRAISKNTFLVIERDSKSPIKHKNAFKKIFKISLKNATNLEQILPTKHIKQDKNLGLIIKGKTLEQLVDKKGIKSLRKYSITPVKKTLVLDLVKSLKYPHDKPEGLFIEDKKLYILNDDDFAVRVKKGRLKQKFLKKGEIEKSVLYVVENVEF